MASGRTLRCMAIGAFVLLIGTVSVSADVLEDANAAYKDGKLKEAIGLYKQAALQGKNPAVCYFNMGNAFFQMDSLPQSIVYYNACLGYAPDFFRGHLNLAITYYTLNDIGSCIAAVRRAIEIEPTEIKPHLLLAAAYRQAGALPEAVAAFEQLVQLDPEAGESYIALAEMYRDLDDYHESIRWLTKYPESGKNKSYVYLLLADLYEHQSDTSRALYYLRSSFDLDKTNKWVFFRMVRTMEAMGNDLVALQEAQRGLEIFPRFAELALTAGNIAFENALYNDAERLYLVARDNGSPGGVVGLENIRLMRQAQAEAEASGVELEVQTSQ